MRNPKSEVSISDQNVGSRSINDDHSSTVSRSGMTSYVLNKIFHLLAVVILLFSLISVSSALGQSQAPSEFGVGRRELLSFKETPSGSNNTFDCTPNGPCVSCLYSEKNSPKFRCSETGYRIPLKCALTKDNQKDLDGKTKNPQNNQSTPADAEAYITYRSCIPAVSEDKLSVLGFEGLMLGILAISGTFIYYRKKRIGAMSASGAVRIPTSSRF